MGCDSKLCSFLTAELKMQPADLPSLICARWWVVSYGHGLENVPTEVLRVKEGLIFSFLLFLTEAQQNNLGRDDKRLIR